MAAKTNGDDEPAREDEGGVSQLDQAPEQPKPRARGKRSVRVTRTRRGATRVTIPDAEPSEPEGAEPKQPPADPEREIQSVVEVEGARPSLPKAIRGKLTIDREEVNSPICDDGVTPADVGWCGSIADSPGYQDTILKKWGGGKYVATGIDKDGKAKAVYAILGGLSKPIPGSAAAPAAGTVGGFSFVGGSNGQGGPLVDEQGYAIGGGQDPVGTGWIWDFGRNQARWMGGGQPSSPPPQAPGSGGYNPGYYDHSRPQVAPELVEVLKEIKSLVAKPAHDSMADFFKLQAANADREFKAQQLKIDADRLKWEQEKEEREAARASERADRVEAARASAKAEEAKAAASVKIAEHQAAAAEKTANAAVSTAEKVAEIQSGANERMMKIMEKRSDSLGDLKALAQVGESLGIFGRGGPQSATAEGAAAIRETVPAITQGIVDVMSMWQMGKGNAPKKDAEGEDESGGGGEDAEARAAEQAKYFKLYGYLLKCLDKKMPAAAMPRELASACMMFDLDEQYLEIRDTLISASPAILAATLESQTKKLGIYEKTKDQVKAARATLTSPEGAKWFNAFRSALADSKREDEEEDRRAGAPAPAEIEAEAPPAAPPPQRPVEPRAKPPADVQPRNKPERN